MADSIFAEVLSSLVWIKMCSCSSVFGGKKKIPIPISGHREYTWVLLYTYRRKVQWHSKISCKASETKMSHLAVAITKFTSKKWMKQIQKDIRRESLTEMGRNRGNGRGWWSERRAGLRRGMWTLSVSDNIPHAIATKGKHHCSGVSSWDGRLGHSPCVSSSVCVSVCVGIWVCVKKQRMNSCFHTSQAQK